MDKYGIIPLSVVPLRAQPAHKAEMISQLLFGDTLTVLDEINKWYKIRRQWDDYEGWLTEDSFIFISSRQFKTLEKEPAIIIDNMVMAHTDDPNDGIRRLPEGSRLPFWNEKDNTCTVGDMVFRLTDIHLEKGTAKARTVITDYAQNFTGVPYLWGGLSSCGFDCSGFVQTIFRICGYRLPRDASQQGRIGKDIPFPDKAKPGDLAFFGNEKDKITHVGIILPDKKIIHASGRVRIDRIDHQGIYNVKKGIYSHKLLLIKDPFHE